MGKIVKRPVEKVASTERLVERNISQFIEDSTENYAIFFKGAPTFVTYYSKMYYTSDNDRQFEAYNEAVGSESPITYNRIEKFPVWNMETSEFNSDESDYGYNGNVTTSFFILPNSIVPNTDDQVEIEISSKRFLFTVVSVESDNMNKAKYYKVSVKLHHKTVEDIERQVTKKSEVDYHLLTEKRKALKDVDHASLIKKVRLVFDKTLYTYRNKYYNDKLCVFHSKHILDQYLNIFIRDNNLNKFFEKYRTSTVISPSIEKYCDPAVYEDTIYELLEEDKIQPEDLARVKKYLVQFDDGKNVYRFNFFLKTKLLFVSYLSELEDKTLEFDFDLTKWMEGLPYYLDEGFLKRQGSNHPVNKSPIHYLEWWMEETATKEEWCRLLHWIEHFPETKNNIEKLLIELKQRKIDNMLINESTFSMDLDIFNELYPYEEINGNLKFIHKYISFIRGGRNDRVIDQLEKDLDLIDLTYRDENGSGYYHGAFILFFLMDLYTYLTNV